MKIKLITALCASAAFSTCAFAQDAAALQSAPATEAAPAAQVSAQPAVAVDPVPVAPALAIVEPSAPTEGVLPENTEVVLTLNEELNSKTHRLGDKFSLTVAQDVSVGSQVVIPRGTRAVGQVTWRTGNGSFGKSGKMDVAFRYVDFNGQQIPIEGDHHQEGAGATGATIGAVVAAGVVGGLIVKGKNARIAEGREFTVRTKEAIPVTLSAAGGPAVIAASYAPTRVNMTVLSEKERKALAKAQKAAAKKKAD
jgi:hypothetical protein